MWGERFVVGDGGVLDLGFDELFEGDFVAVDELRGVKFGGATLDELLGEVKGIFVDFDFLDVAEVVLGVAELGGVAHGVAHHAAIGRGGDGNDVFATAKSDFREGYFLGVFQGLADDREGLGLGFVFGDAEVGFLVELGVDVGFVDELSDLHGVLGRDAEVGKLRGLDGDVLAFLVLVTFYNFVFFYDWGGGRRGCGSLFGGVGFNGVAEGLAAFCWASWAEAVTF